MTPGQGDDFLDFALYVSFFPQLVAGPIERSSRLLPQVQQDRHVTFEDFRAGLHLVVLGLFKKVVIADNMAPIVSAIFSKPTDELTGLECLVGVYAFAFQIYGDFSGYSSIAKGVARWMELRHHDGFLDALPCDLASGLLAPLAHQPVYLATRLPVCPARGKPRFPCVYLSQVQGRSCRFTWSARRIASATIVSVQF